MELNGLSVKKGQAIAFLDGRLVIADGNMPQVILDLLAMMDVEEGELITIYYGADTESAEAEQVAESVQRKYPSQEVELVAGGQPYYNYIVSVE
jgi:hypothetical protein